MIKIYTHQVRNANPKSLSFALEGDTIRLKAVEDSAKQESGYIAQVVRTRELGLGYGRGIYGFDKLIQLPIDAATGDILHLFETTDSHYHTHYWLERETAQPNDSANVSDNKPVRTYKHHGDHLEEQPKEPRKKKSQ